MIRTLRFKVKQEAFPWLNAAAIEVNQVWNWCNERSSSVFGNLGKRLSGFDLCYASAGTSKCFSQIGARTINSVCVAYAVKRAWRRRLRWRVSSGSRRSLGWVPFTASQIKRNGEAVRFAGKTFRVFESERLEGV
jgi:hypothetical protein